MIKADRKRYQSITNDLDPNTAKAYEVTCEIKFTHCSLRGFCCYTALKLKLAVVLVKRDTDFSRIKRFEFLTFIAFNVITFH